MADDTGAAGSSAGVAGSSPASTATAPSPSAVNTPASATPTPAGSGTVAQDPGPLPFARHKEILDGAYSERDAARKALQDSQQKYGWVDQFQGEPMPFLEQWIDQMVAHPEHGPKLLAKAARLLQSRRGTQQAQQPTDEPQANVPIVDQQGNITGYTYDAAQLTKWRQWDRAQQDTALADRLAPLEAMRERQVQAEQRAQIQHTAEQQARTVLTELRSQPSFTEHEAAIKQALLDHDEWGDNIHRAYAHVLTTQVLPTLSRTEQQKVLDGLQTKAAGSTVSPGSPAPVQKPKFKDFGDALRYYSEHPDEAAVMAKR